MMSLLNNPIFLQISASDLANELSSVIGQNSGSGAAGIDWNFLISTGIITMGIVVTLLQLFGPSVSVKDETLRKSAYLDDMQKKIDDKIANTNENADDLGERFEKLKDEIQTIKEKVNKLQADINNLEFQGRTQKELLEDIKREQRQLVDRMDNILRQMLDLLS